MAAVTLRTGAWYGDRALTLDFPGGWDVTVAESRPMDALDDAALRARLRQPVGTLPLADLARGRTRAAVLIDDIMRPTPTARLLPLILEELERGGLSRGAVRIVVASGAHSEATDEDIRKKVGALGASVTVVPHRPADDLAYLGRSARGTPLYVNRTVAEADLRVGVGGLYPHPVAGFSGGSKILVPGVCGQETVRYVHDTFTGAGRRGGSLENPFRQESEAIARTVPLHFIVNVLLTPSREIAGLFAGDPVGAHRDGVQAASERCRVAMVEDADVIVANTYPFDASLYFIPRGFWPFATGSRAASRVAIADGSMGQGHHGFRPPKRQALARLARAAAMLQPTERGRQERRVALEMLTKLRTRRQAEFLMLCPGLRAEELAAKFPKAELFREWDGVLRVLRARHPQPRVKVAVYPCAPLQLPDEGGTGR